MKTRRPWMGPGRTLASLAVFLVFVMTVHIGVSLYLGYGLQ